MKCEKEKKKVLFHMKPERERERNVFQLVSLSKLPLFLEEEKRRRKSKGTAGLTIIMFSGREKSIYEGVRKKSAYKNVISFFLL